MAVISIDAKPKTAHTSTNAYEPATFVKTPDLSGDGIIFGFPGHSTTLYASSASFQGMRPEKYVFRKHMAGVNPNRLLLEMNNAQIAAGESGGPVYDNKGRVLGLLEGWTAGPGGHHVYANPLSNKTVKGWLSTVRARAAPTD